MDALRIADFEEARATPPGLKLKQALALMQQGLDMKRRKILAADPRASHEEVEARLVSWMSEAR